jgi:hypothetical protein
LCPKRAATCSGSLVLWYSIVAFQWRNVWKCISVRFPLTSSVSSVASAACFSIRVSTSIKVCIAFVAMGARPLWVMAPLAVRKYGAGAIYWPALKCFVEVLFVRL